MTSSIDDDDNHTEMTANVKEKTLAVQIAALLGDHTAEWREPDISTTIADFKLLVEPTAWTSELFAEATAEAVADAAPVYTTWNDAKVYRPISQDLLTRTITLGYGANRDSKKWKSTENNLGFVIDTYLSMHRVGEKDGRAIVLGSIDGPERTNGAMRHMAMLGVDVDRGMDFDSLCQIASDSGLLCILYNTHSSGVSAATIKKTELLKWIKSPRAPTYEDGKRYLMEVRGFEPELFAETGTLGEKTDGKNGLSVVVPHLPIEKTRLLFLLKEPFDILHRDVDPAAGLEEWKERVRGFCQKLGIPYDEAALESARLFYLARHAEGKDPDQRRIVIFGGEPVDIEAYPRVKKATTAAAPTHEPDPLAVVAREMGAKDGVSSAPTCDIDRVIYAHAADFQMAELYHDYEPQSKSRNGAGYQGRCPYDDEHRTGAGNPDSVSFWCTDGDGDKQFSAQCSSETCGELRAWKGNDGKQKISKNGKPMQDRAKFVRKLCEDAGLTAEDLRSYVHLDEGAVFVLDREKNEDKTNTVEPLDLKSGKLAIKALPAEDATDAILHLFAGIAAGVLTKTLKTPHVEELKTEWCKTRKPGVWQQHLKEAKYEAEATAKKAKALAKREAAEDPEANPFFEDMDHFIYVSQKNGTVAYPDVVDGWGFINWGAFEKMYREKYESDLEEDGQLLTKANAWLLQPKTMTEACVKVTFKPGMTVEKFVPLGGKRLALNTYTGLAVEPVEGPLPRTEQHVLEVVAAGDLDAAEWWWDWHAHVMQTFWKDPKTFKLPIAPVFKGKQGTGKSIIEEAVRDGFGRHGVSLADQNHIIGRFSTIRAQAIFVIGEEAFFAGDKKVEGVLKDMISGNQVPLEFKGITAVMVPNHCHLVLISNEDDPVPILDGDRRFKFFNVSDHRKVPDADGSPETAAKRVENEAYWAALVAELCCDSGRAALLHKLLHHVPRKGFGYLRYDVASDAKDESIGNLIPVLEKAVISWVHSGYLLNKVLGEEEPTCELINGQDTDLIVSDELAAGLRYWISINGDAHEKRNAKQSPTAIGKAVVRLLPGLKKNPDTSSRGRLYPSHEDTLALLEKHATAGQKAHLATLKALEGEK